MILLEVDYQVAEHLVDVILSHLVGVDEEEDTYPLLGIGTQELQPQLNEHLQELNHLIHDVEGTDRYSLVLYHLRELLEEVLLSLLLIYTLVPVVLIIPIQHELHFMRLRCLTLLVYLIHLTVLYLIHNQDLLQGVSIILHSEYVIVYVLY